MKRVVPVLAVSAAAVAGCARPAVSVEVLPPRTSVTCAAPDAKSASFGRGLLDVLTTLGAHGGYVGDVRLSAPGVDVRVDAIKVAYTGLDDTSVALDEFDGDVPTGGATLSGQDDELREGVVENIEFVSRDLAVALNDDDGLAIDKLEFARLGVTLTPVVDDTVADAVSSTFALDVCKGCLVTPPDACSGDGQFVATPVVCRPGQDIPLFVCNAAAAVAP
jgi:hypothetical protein